MRKCNIESCEKKHHAKGYCSKHYGIICLPSIENTILCDVEGCTTPLGAFRKKGQCKKHEKRIRVHGDPHKVLRVKNAFKFIGLWETKEQLLNYNFNSRGALSQAARIYYGESCVNCGWDKGKCEAHHIIKRSKGGLNTINNIKVLCPNCHRLQHKVDIDYLTKDSKDLILKLKKE